ncbi:MAG: hypothetical protein ABII82_03130 [Verrucomicrobiota bacterium]
MSPVRGLPGLFPPRPPTEPIQRLRPAPPQSKKSARSADTRPDSPLAIRQRHLMWEKCIRSIGILFYLPAILLIHRAAMILSGRAPETPTPVGLFLAAFGVIFVIAGYGFRRLDPAFRYRGGVLAGLSLILFAVPGFGLFHVIGPAGIAICAYVLFLIFGPPGRVVYSADYQKAIAATPHIKASPPVIVWVAFAALLLFSAMTMAGLRGGA